MYHVLLKDNGNELLICPKETKETALEIKENGVKNKFTLNKKELSKIIGVLLHIQSNNRKNEQ